MEFIKKGAILALSGLLLVHSPIQAKAELVENKGNKYLYDQGHMKKEWQKVDGNYRYFDKETGQMWTNGYGLIDGKQYYFDKDGNLLKGWKKVFGLERYFDPATGELYKDRKATINGKTYKFDKNGGFVQVKEEASPETYYLETSKSKYRNAGDASLGRNKLEGRLEAGNYYIYKKYAGMLNLSKSPTSPGAWINPAEVGEDGGQTKLVNHNILNVRSGKSVSSKKLGQLKRGDEIYGRKDGAWFEFTYKGKKAYVSDKLLKDKLVEVEDQGSNQVKPVEKFTRIMGKTQVSEGQMVNYLKKVYPNAKKEIYGFPGLYLEEGAKEGVRGDIAFAQALLETGNFKFPNTHISIEQNNFCGLGVTGSGVQGESFESPRIGIRAQIQHLKAYASKEDVKLEIVDPRYHYVERANSPYVEWLGAYENPKGTGWAYSPKYGEKILNILDNIARMDGR